MEAIILLAQTRTMAAVEIVIILIIAAVIGYLTAYFYYKSVYTPKIRALETEKEHLNHVIDGLNADKSRLQSRIRELEEELVTQKPGGRKKTQQ